MINVDDLLKPIAESNPCGEDCSYTSFPELERLAKGTPEVEMGAVKKPAEDPNWKEVQDKALEVLKQSKHLGAGVILTVSLVKTGGLDGLRDGLAVVRGLTEKYWPQLYPKLDAEENNDPTERLNTLSNLSSPRFAGHVRQIVLCNSAAMGRITLHHVLAAKDKIGKPEASGQAKSGNSEPSLSQIQAAFREAGAEPAKASLGLVKDAMAQAKGLETFIDTTLGAGKGVNFEMLNKLLVEMKQAVEPYAGDGTPAAAAQPGAAGDGQSRPKPPAPPPGTIQSPADVIDALNRICEYYEKNEPSSPVPLILQRAQRLVDKKFTEILTDLTPDALKQLQVITGIKPDK